jgi:Arc/MetJ-type ribon-helix-helix transcriptional regulator
MTPTSPKAAPTKFVGVRLPVELAAELAEHAEWCDEYVSETVRRAVRVLLDAERS